MTTIQVTLDLDDSVAEKIKSYAEENHTDLNTLLKAYVVEVAHSKEVKGEEEIAFKKDLKNYPEWIQRLVIADKPTPDFDHKAEYRKHMEEKYGL